MKTEKYHMKCWGEDHYLKIYYSDDGSTLGIDTPWHTRDEIDESFAEAQFGEPCIPCVKLAEDIKSEPTFALWKSIKDDDPTLARIAIAFGAKFDLHKDSALVAAANECNSKIVKLLLDAGAYPSSTGNQAIHIATLKGDLETVKLLLAAENYNNTPHQHNLLLMIASRRGYLEIAKLFIEHGSNVNAAKAKALRDAASNNKIDVVRLLLENGADPNLIQPKHLSRILGFAKGEIQNLLESHGLDYDRLRSHSSR